MPQAIINGYHCNYRFDDFEQDEILVFSNSLGCDLTMWEEQVDILSHHFNILRYDTRGHGESGVGDTAPTIADLGADVIALLDHLNITEPVHFCGLSMGGLIGQWLGIHKGDRFEKIILSNTAAKIGDVERWNERIENVLTNGMEVLREGASKIWFTEKFRSEQPEEVAAMVTKLVTTDVKGYTDCCMAVRDADFREQLYDLEVPVFVISSDKDEVTTNEHGRFLAQRIPLSRHATLNTAHLANIEKGEEFSKYILFFADH